MEIVVRATLVFALLFVLMRGLRKRTLAEMSPFEMILLVTFGDIVQQGVTQEDYSLTGVVLAVGTFAFWISVMSWLSYRFPRARKAIEGVPLVIVENGRPVEATMRLEQMPLEEVMEAARQQGIADLAEVRLAVLEPSGKLSFIKAADQAVPRATDDASGA
jgi:uncharacterized membrane protein YcaP (DUF421 family)